MKGRFAGGHGPIETVLVTGVGGPAGRAVTAWLVEAGVRVVGTDVREVETRAHLRWVPAANAPGFAEAILRLVEAERPSLLVPTVSEELPIVARLRSALLARGCALAMGAPRGVDVAGDKLLTAEALARAGVSVPRTLPGPTPREELVEALGLPVLAKPRVGRGGRGVHVFHAEGELPPTGPTDGIWQEFIPGDEFDVNLFVERDGELSAGVVLRKTALRDGETGNAAGVERVDAREVRGLAERAVRAVGLAGPLDVDVRLRRDGTPAVLEINARLGANSLSAPEVLEALADAWRAGRCA
jgi:carbamoyl-phosphate synthase large subunit